MFLWVGGEYLKSVNFEGIPFGPGLPFQSFPSKKDFPCNPLMQSESLYYSVQLLKDLLL